MKRLITWILLGFVAASVGYVVYTETRPRPAGQEAGGTGGASASMQPAVTVYYFHGNYRCPTCMKLEKYSHEAVQEAFTNELASGKLVWKVVNIEEPENEHFVEDFELTTRSLVVTGTKEGKPGWVNLERIWDLVGDPPAFKAYVQAEMRAFLPEQK